MNAIKLNFINLSNDINNNSIVIFQKNIANEYNNTSIAWTVIQNCSPTENHPFLFPLSQQLSISDTYGNFTPMQEAQTGQSFEMIKSPSGDRLQLTSTPSLIPTTIEIKNNLDNGAINANIFKDGKLLASKHNIVPSQKAIFEFKPTIFIGVAAQIEEGEIINSAILSDINTELSLLGIASADIVMTGGGPGANATPFHFSLTNVKYA